MRDSLERRQIKEERVVNKEVHQVFILIARELTLPEVA
jgi:hypothetical protein